MKTYAAMLSRLVVGAVCPRSSQPAPAMHRRASSTTDPDQVRGHADRAFEKLKQEEQERAAQPPVPR